MPCAQAGPHDAVETALFRAGVFSRHQTLSRHHDNIGAAAFVALVYADVQGLPFYATLIIKLVIFAAVYSAVLIGLHRYPAIA
jgi:hypothetical protein